MANRRFALAWYLPETGELVSGWGPSDDGRVITNFPESTDEWANAVAAREGKAIVVGGAKVNGKTRIAMAKYGHNGALDPGFGTAGNGMVVDAVDQSSEDEARDVVIDAQGRIVVAGYSTFADKRTFAVSRYLPDGILDEDFGPDKTGRVFSENFVSYEDSAEANAVAIDGSTQHILVAGEADNAFNHKSFAVARYDDEGVPDVFFSQNGKQSAKFPDGQGEIAMTVLPTKGDSVTAGGYVELIGESHFGFARFNNSGNLDTGFSADGMLVTPFTGMTESGATRILTAAGSNFYAVGYATAGNETKFAVAKYTWEGNLNTDFSGDGWLTTGDFDGSESAIALAGTLVTSFTDEYLLAAGYAVVNGAPRFALARYDLSGPLYLDFGNNGKVTTTFPGTNSAIARDVTMVQYGQKGPPERPLLAILAVGWVES
jgi:uncharacterized delta-60 repeat protein